MKERLRSNEKAVYRMLNAALLTCMALFGAAEFLGAGGGIHLFTALAVVGMLTGMNFLSARGRMFGTAALLGLLGVGVAVAGPEESLAFLRSFPPWLLGGRVEAVPMSFEAMTGTQGAVPMPFETASGIPGAVPEAWIFGYGMLQAAMVAVLCYGIQILFEKIPLLKRIFAAVIFATMLTSMFLQREMNHFAVAFLLTYVILVCGEWIQSLWEKVRKEGNSREAHTLWILPFLLLYLVFLAASPVPEKPYDWKWAKRMVTWVEDTFLTLTQNLKWGDREGFGVAFSGFSENTTLTGELREEADEVMAVWVQSGGLRSGEDSLYLTGNVLDSFDGRSWSRKRQGLPGEAFLDTAQTLCAVRKINQTYQRDYLREVHLDIRYEDFNTAYVFAPLKTWELEQWDGKKLDYVCQGEELGWGRRRGYGTEYRLQYFRMNLGQREFDLALEQARETDESILISVLQECSRRSGHEFTADDVAAYREAVYRDYLEEAVLSEEAEDYLREITEGAGTDIEKLRAIERELAGFSYTRTPGDLPERVTGPGEFLDYFLLGNREGYCTYFATAFVLLARAEGIPARYAQGYCVPVEKGRISVYSGMAHAWPEAYLDGVGWIPFEPTPGYGGRRYHPWELEQPQAGEPEDSVLIAPERESGAGTGMAETVKSGEGRPEENPEEPEPEDSQRNRGLLWKLPGIAAGAALLGCAVVWALDGALYRYRYRRMKPGERFRTEVFRNLEILRFLGLERKTWETLQEVGEKAAALPDLEDILPIRCLESYERVIYGGKEADEDMVKKAARERERLLGKLRERKKWAFVYCCLKMHCFPAGPSAARGAEREEEKDEDGRT